MIRPVLVTAIAAMAILSSVVVQRAPNLTGWTIAQTYRATTRCQPRADASASDSALRQVAQRTCSALLAVSDPLLSRFSERHASTIASGSATYPLRVSGNGRYLVDANDNPFLMVGDSPQALIGNLAAPDAELFLETRRKQGFNTIWVNLLCNDYTACNADGSTFDGIQPFRVRGDLSTPNDEYFSRADGYIALAAQYGFVVLLDPIETGGWLDVLRANGEQKAYDYGRYLGQRYSGFANIIWMSGNDFKNWLQPADDQIVLAVARGIADVDDVHLHTVEMDWPQVSSSRDDPLWSSVIQLDAAYTYTPTYAEVLREYNRQPAMPVFMVEANYELENDFTGPRTLRVQEYWTALSGAAGQLYGNRFVWRLGPGWKDHLDSLGAQQVGHMVDLFQSRAWYDLIPDQDHSLVSDGYGTFQTTGNVNASDYVTAAQTGNGSLAIAYVPTGRALTVDLSKLAGPLWARWYDPTNGSFQSVSSTPLPSAGKHQFGTPGKNNDGDDDWVLVLETAR